jgi:hypothetical protein
MRPRLAAAAILLPLVLGCDEPHSEPAQRAEPAQRPEARGSMLRVSGTSFRTNDGRRFHWRGITAFRLLDYVSDKREDEVERYLSWAASHHLTVVRVLAMGTGFLSLTPEEGRAALPRLLEMAARHGMYVEVVALAGTAEVPVNLAEQVAAIGRIAAAHPNAFLEIANEPVHPTQAPEVHRAEVLQGFARELPEPVNVALGSVERGDGFAAGDYVTWHVPREDAHDGWGHVLAIAAGAELLTRWKKPVISDEPIGAGPKYEPGRRDDNPSRFRAAALLTRLAGLGVTFHYEGGLQARIPEGRELECFNAWNEASTLLPDDVEQKGTFRAGGTPGAVVSGYNRQLLGVFERSTASGAWVLAIGAGEPQLKLTTGWREARVRAFDGARLIELRR